MARQQTRRAFSLLEVILALAILTGAMAVLGELARWGLNNADKSRKLTQAQLLCESKMAEVTSGYLLLEPVYQASFAEEDVLDSDVGSDYNPGAVNWLYTIDVTPLDDAGLMEVVVTVEQDLPLEMRPVRYSLVRWMIDEELLMGEEETDGSTEGEIL